MNIQTILKHVAGLKFKVVGPLLVADLSQKGAQPFDSIPVGTHGMEKVGLEQKTEPHTHEFTSFYKSIGLNVECDGRLFKLPKKALTIVLEGVSHSWTPKEHTGKVGSVDLRHRAQVLVTA